MKVFNTELIKAAKQKKGVSVMSNERYRDFLKFALQRILEVATLYETEAKTCKDPVNKLFLYFLAGKKRVQHVLLEMVASSSVNTESTFEFPGITAESTTEKFKCALSLANTDEIVQFARARAEKDLNLYVSLAALEEDTQTKKLLVTLSKLSRDFIHDINTGYAKFIQKQNKQTHSPSGVSTLANVF